MGFQLEVFFVPRFRFWDGFFLYGFASFVQVMHNKGNTGRLVSEATRNEKENRSHPPVRSPAQQTNFELCRNPMQQETKIPHQHENRMNSPQKKKCLYRNIKKLASTWCWFFKFPLSTWCWFFSFSLSLSVGVSYSPVPKVRNTKNPKSDFISKHMLQLQHQKGEGGTTYLLQRSLHSTLNWFPITAGSAVLCCACLVRKLTLAGLEPAIFGSEDQRLIH